MVEKEVIDVADMPDPYGSKAEKEIGLTEAQLFKIENLMDAKKVFEREFIKRKLSEKNNSITQTAEAIGVKRSYLSKKLKTL